MYKKLLILIPILIILAGCSAKYEVEIKNNKVIEKSSFIIDKSLVEDNNIYYAVAKLSGKYFLNTDFLLGGNIKEYYDDNKAIYQKSSDTNISNYNNSDIFRYCYDAHNVIIDDDYIMITTSDKFKCFDLYEELDDVDIILKSNHKLIETNADVVDGYIYKWHITKDNAKDKKIYIKLQKDKFVFNYENEFVKKMLIISGIIVIIALIGFVIFRKNRKASKI